MFILIKLNLVPLNWFVMVTSFGWSTRSTYNQWNVLLNVSSFKHLLLILISICVFYDFFFLFWGGFRTTRNLHSHLHEAPMTKKHFQVTGYGIVSIAPHLKLISWVVTCYTIHNSTTCSYLTFQLWSLHRMALETQMTCGRWRCAGVRRATWSRCCAAKSAFFTELRDVCCTPPERLYQSGTTNLLCCDSASYSVWDNLFARELT